MRVCLVTWRGLPDLAPDDRLLRDALIGRGAAVDVCVWDDPLVDWRSYDAVVLRSTWDYHLRVGEFRRWLDGLDGVRLWNPATLVRANIHKSYLLDLASRGVPVVPTLLLRRGDQHVAPGRSVVKPVVSATAFGTFVVEEGQTIRASDGDLLVQPFLREVIEEGEWSLVFFGSHFSHAMLKRPADGDFRVQHDFGGSASRVAAPAELVDGAAAVLATLAGPWLYARVDGVRAGGRFLLMELELTEPSLFLDEASAARFAEAIVRA